MESIGRIAICTLLFTVALVAASAQQVQTDFDPQASFIHYKTYS
jgi:hypothetical protein